LGIHDAEAASHHSSGIVQGSGFAKHHVIVADRGALTSVSFLGGVACFFSPVASLAQIKSSK
jgi:hypothetical protein